MPNVLSMLRRVDWLLFLSVFALSGLGLLAIWSVDLAQDAGRFLNFKRQLTFVVSGVILALLTSALDWRALRSTSRALYLLGLVLLAGVLIAGVTIRGTQGWFRIGGTTFQPVELAKIFLVIGLAKYLSRSAHIVDFKALLSWGIISGLYIGLTLIQPDFGSALVLTAIAAGMLLLAQVPRRYFLWGAALLALVLTMVWHTALAEYQKDRLRAFVDPGADPFGKGYNIRQSVIAIGSGGVFGRGLGQGSQSQLRFLPEAQTDFIFAVLAEQLGFVIAVLMLIAYAVMWWRLRTLMKQVQDGFAQFVIAGFFMMVAVQVTLNIGMNLGLLPIVGLPLPFVSLGGSAMLSNFLMLGVVQSIKVRG